MRFIQIILAVSLLIILSACASTGGQTAAQKRQNIIKMRNQVLQELYQHKPSAKSMIASAPGYAVFSNGNVNIIFLSVSGGYGVVTRKNASNVYMKMAEAGIGLGLGVKDFRAVFVFHDNNTLDQFIKHGWQFGAHADAAAKASEQGAAVAGEMLVDNITVFQITESGLALQATLKGTRYWKDDELN
ncbi:YSC84-related protein [Pleionea sp. CnH1-48]|uniref:lipid-binding SYLF domain-containing protein n=1 Tax=Pleionea sp. CnH1-48 TaxID=2954494 RepID=UPI0020984A93|nr:YSC84-related protein [Pleionea sp. CnH1-48]MCO7226460.1 YSC84-related protein [Pleionea sp. CnH1-48]